MKLTGPIVHGACGRTWTGSLRAHCPACHETFNRDSGADRHRTGRWGSRVCIHPSTPGMRNIDGVWYAPAGDNPFAS